MLRNLYVAGNVGPSFGDFNISFTPAAVGLVCPVSSLLPAPAEHVSSVSGRGSSVGSWMGPINHQYSDTDCPNVGCHPNQKLGICETLCDGLKGCNALNYSPGGCCLRACASDKLLTKNSSSAGGLSYYRVGPAPPPCVDIKTSTECLEPLCHWDGKQCTLPVSVTVHLRSCPRAMCPKACFALAAAAAAIRTI